MSEVLVKVLYVDGMSCANCESRIERALAAAPGVVKVRADSLGQTVRVEYAGGKANVGDWARRIEAEGYRVLPNPPVKARGKRHWIAGALMLALAGAVVIAMAMGAQLMPRITSGMSYGLLFVTGLLTSLHCVAMCGGINMSQTAGGQRGVLPALLYNIGRVVSYTIIGALVGAVGSVIPMPSWLKAAITVFAGLFMIIMGLNLMGVFPALGRLVPKMPKSIGRALGSHRSGTPFVVGLLNGLMPCGPLQSMQLYALGAGGMMQGAMAMLMFSLGTVPLMFALGAASALLSQKFARRMMAASAVLVLVLGVFTIGRGLSLTGTVDAGLNPVPNVQAVAAVATPEPIATQPPKSAIVMEPTDPPEQSAQDDSGVQRVTSKLTTRGYPEISVKVGQPVEWTIQASEKNLNGCNYMMEIPTYGLEIELHAGDNLIQFTPEKTGTIKYSCWMGMIHGKIHVTE